MPRDPGRSAHHSGGAHGKSRVLVMSHSRAARGGQVRGGIFAGARGQAPGSIAGSARGPEEGLAGRSRGAAGRGGAARECALQQGREEGQRGSGAQNGGAVRHLCDGCLRHRASRRGQHPWGGEVRSDRLRGPALVSELSALETALEKPARPLLAIVAGSKVSTSSRFWNPCSARWISSSWAAASRIPFSPRWGSTWASRSTSLPCWTSAGACLDQSKSRGIVIPMPTDVVVATEFSARAEADVKAVGAVSTRT